MATPTTILIAEDQGMMRSALAVLLDLEDDQTGHRVVAGTAGQAKPAEVLRHLRRLTQGPPASSPLNEVDKLIVSIPGTWSFQPSNPARSSLD